MCDVDTTCTNKEKQQKQIARAVWRLPNPKSQIPNPKSQKKTTTTTTTHHKVPPIFTHPHTSQPTHKREVPIEWRA
jgi:hypothetical protein